MTSLLSVQQLSKSYNASTNPWKKNQKLQALWPIDFELQEGKTLAIVGESGCGKTTLAKQITFIEEPDTGEIFIDGNKVSYQHKAGVKKIRHKIQMVFQNPYSSLNPRRRIFEQLEEPLLINTAHNKVQRAAQVEDIMNKVGLKPEHRFGYPHMFSGGQCQRIAIARAMILHPSILVADEPTSALDVSVQAQILNLFMDLQDSLKIAFIIISHNLSVVEHIAHEVIVMYLGKAVEKADKKTLFKTPLHPYTQALLSATPFLDPKRQQKRIKIAGEIPSLLNLPTGCTFCDRCKYAQKRCREVAPLLQKIGTSQVACHFAKDIRSH